MGDDAADYGSQDEGNGQSRPYQGADNTGTLDRPYFDHSDLGQGVETRPSNTLKRPEYDAAPVSLGFVRGLVPSYGQLNHVLCQAAAPREGDEDGPRYD